MSECTCCKEEDKVIEIQRFEDKNYIVKKWADGSKHIFIKDLIIGDSKHDFNNDFCFYGFCWCCGNLLIRPKNDVFRFCTTAFRWDSIIKDSQEGLGKKTCKFWSEDGCSASDRSTGVCKGQYPIGHNYHGNMPEVFLDTIILPLFCGNLKDLYSFRKRARDKVELFFLDDEYKKMKIILKELIRSYPKPISIKKLIRKHQAIDLLDFLHTYYLIWNNNDYITTGNNIRDRFGMKRKGLSKYVKYYISPHIIQNLKRVYINGALENRERDFDQTLDEILENIKIFIKQKPITYALKKIKRKFGNFLVNYLTDKFGDKYIFK